jgi:hypothetical protein
MAPSIRLQAQRLLEEVEALPEPRRFDVVHAAISDDVNGLSSPSERQHQASALRLRGGGMTSS